MGYVYKGAMVSTALRVLGRFGWLHILCHSLLPGSFSSNVITQYEVAAAALH